MLGPYISFLCELRASCGENLSFPNTAISASLLRRSHDFPEILDVRLQVRAELRVDDIIRAQSELLEFTLHPFHCASLAQRSCEKGLRFLR